MESELRRLPWNNQSETWLASGRALQSGKNPGHCHHHDPEGANQENHQDRGNEIESQDYLNQPAGQAVAR